MFLRPEVHTGGDTNQNQTKPLVENLIENNTAKKPADLLAEALTGSTGSKAKKPRVVVEEASSDNSTTNGPKEGPPPDGPTEGSTEEPTIRPRKVPPRAGTRTSFVSDSIIDGRDPQVEENKAKSGQRSHGLRCLSCGYCWAFSKSTL